MVLVLTTHLDCLQLCPNCCFTNARVAPWLLHLMLAEPDPSTSLHPVAHERDAFESQVTQAYYSLYFSSM